MKYCKIFTNFLVFLLDFLEILPFTVTLFFAASDTESEKSRIFS